MSEPLAPAGTSQDKTKEERSRHARKMAAAAVGAVAVFAALFLGLVTLIAQVAPVQEEEAPEPDSQTVPAPDQADVQAPTDPFYLLLIGSDSRKGTALYTGKANEHAQVDQHSDIITLVRVDPQSYVVTLITVPRDTVVPGHTEKINDALLQNDPEQVVAAVAELTGVTADYYAMVTFTGFEALVDAAGGITVDVPVTVTVPDPATAESVTVEAGAARHLNGSETLVFSRARKEYPYDQDALRQVNVRTVEEALLRQVLSLQASPAGVGKVLDALTENVQTNMDLAVAAKLFNDFAAHADQLTVYGCTGPHEGAERASDGLWVVEGDYTAEWQRIISLANEGFDPSVVVDAPDFDDVVAQLAAQEEEDGDVEQSV